MAPNDDSNLTSVIALLLLLDRLDEDDPEAHELAYALARRLYDTRLFGRLPFPPERLVRKLLESHRRTRAYGDPVFDKVYPSRFQDFADRLGLFERHFAIIDSKLRESEEKFADQLGLFEKHFAIVDSKLRESEEKTAVTRDLINELTWGLSVGVDPAEMKIRRLLPIRVYLAEAPDPPVRTALFESISRILEALDFDQDLELPEETGSWWKRFWAKSRVALTQDEVQVRIAAAERAAQAKLLDKPQAEANKDHATAIASLMQSLNEVPSACIQIGNLLLVKHDTKVLVRTLTPSEMQALERKQSMLSDPAQIIERLEHACTKKGLDMPQSPKPMD